jgi:hypothetical protein
MSSRELQIHEIYRLPEVGTEDRLNFARGVNVIVGQPNTGKSKWLRMIDYAFGKEGAAEEIFGDDLAQKYESITMRISAAGEEWSIQRKWREAGLRTKTTINGEVMDLREASNLLMSALDIPVVHYPQGNVYGSRTWPELGWRSLFRHVYRRQSGWSQIADDQPFSEQHACLMQFFGIAKYLFSKEFSELISKEKRIMELQSEREQFLLMLHELSKEIIDEKELGVALTPESLESAVTRIERELQDLRTQRDEVLTALLHGAQRDGSPANNTDEIEKLGERLSELQVKQEEVLRALRKAESRVVEIEEYRNLVANEYARMQRAIAAGSALADLKITHCPACDRELTDSENNKDICYLCQRHYDITPRPAAETEQRLKFELDQLQGETRESDQLLEILNRDVQALNKEYDHHGERISEIQRILSPFRSAVASVIPPEIGVIDQHMGSLHERLRQLDRIKSMLSRRQKISDQILSIQADVARLNREVADQAINIDFEKSSSTLEDGMNTYLNLIGELKPTAWTQEAVNVRLRERNFRIGVGRSDWSAKLGGTLTLYFLLAYHYALLTLSSKPEYRYPGLAILDFPAELEDATSVADKENFVLEPFVRMLKKPELQFAQVIAAGSSFENLRGANRIELTRIW